MWCRDGKVLACGRDDGYGLMPWTKRLQRKWKRKRKSCLGRGMLLTCYSDMMDKDEDHEMVEESVESHAVGGETSELGLSERSDLQTYTVAMSEDIESLTLAQVRDVPHGITSSSWPRNNVLNDVGKSKTKGWFQCVVCSLYAASSFNVVLRLAPWLSDSS